MLKFKIGDRVKCKISTSGKNFLGEAGVVCSLYDYSDSHDLQVELDTGKYWFSEDELTPAPAEDKAEPSRLPLMKYKIGDRVIIHVVVDDVDAVDDIAPYRVTNLGGLGTWVSEQEISPDVDSSSAEPHVTEENSRKFNVGEAVLIEATVVRYEESSKMVRTKGNLQVTCV